MTDKAIVTNMNALTQKYGAAGVRKVQKAVKELIAADKKRGLTTTLIALDDASAMKKLKAIPVKDAANPQQNKMAIDGVYQALEPDYLMILGATDVVTPQELRNPLYKPNPDGDTDQFAYGDLPYACDAPFSQRIQDFTGPTRVVGRLPDLTGAQGNPEYLIRLLRFATKWKSLPRWKYQNYLGISAQAWRASSAESLTHIFGSDKDLQTTPKKSYKWKPNLINRRAHFINCHGGDTYPNFLGQSATDDDDMPISHQAAFIAKSGNIVEGTVVAAECCYGGQLYDPSGADGEQMGICNTYLARKAYGVFASTTIAYGPDEGNDQADLICRYFLEAVLSGASLGRAALEARQRLIEKSSPLGPMNRKTLAQFNLYGDPSIVPVATSTQKVAAGPSIMLLTPRTKAIGQKRSTLAKTIRQTESIERGERREKLYTKGMVLYQLQPSVSKIESGPPKNVASSLKKLASRLDLEHIDMMSFSVKAPKTSSLIRKTAIPKGRTKALSTKIPNTTAFHVFIGIPKSAVTKAVAKKAGTKALISTNGQPKNPPIRKFVVLEAKEVNGKIISVSQANSK